MKTWRIIFSLSLVLSIVQSAFPQTYYWPVSGAARAFTSTFGPRNLGSAEYSSTTGYDYDFHGGMDLRVNQQNNNIVPVTDGIVTNWYSTGQSAYIEIQHEDDYGTYYARYYHMTPSAAVCSVGCEVFGGTTVIGTTVDYNSDNTGSAFPNDHLDVRYYPGDPKLGPDLNTDNPGIILEDASRTYDDSEIVFIDTAENLIPVSNNQFHLASDPITLHHNPAGLRYFIIGVKIARTALSINSVKADLCGQFGGSYYTQNDLLKNNNTETYELNHPGEVIYYDDYLNNSTINPYRAACGDRFISPTVTREDSGHVSNSVGIYPRSLGSDNHIIYFRWYVSDIWSYMDYIEATFSAETWSGNETLRFSIPIGRTISGYITSDGTRSGTPINSVTMRGVSNEPSTDIFGQYKAIVPDGWSGTVTPEKSVYTFTPDHKDYTNVIADRTTTLEDYTGTQTITYTISGYVRTSGGAGISGVTMSGLPGSPSTGATGYYSAIVQSGWTGTVTPSKANYTFSPSTWSYNTPVTSDQTNQDYTGTLPTYTISGYIKTSSNAAISGVAMNGLPGNPSTDASGYYSGTIESGWTGTVTPIKSGYSFSPSSWPYNTPVTANQNNQDYTGTTTTTYTISGHVRTSGGAGISNVAMNGLPGTPYTDASGYYYGIVNSGWTGTVTPAIAGYSFSPSSWPYNAPVTSDKTNQDYTGTQVVTYTISGYVRTSSQTPISGVTMSGLPGNPSTNSSGYYFGIVSENWSGTVTPSKTNYNFDPLSWPYTLITSDLIDQNFTGTQIPSSGASIYGISISPTVILPGQSSITTTFEYSNKLQYPRICSYTFAGSTYVGTQAWLTVIIDEEVIWYIYDNSFEGYPRDPIEGTHSCLFSVSVGRHTYSIKQTENVDGCCYSPDTIGCNVYYSSSISGSFDVTYAPVTLTLNPAVFLSPGIGGKYLVNSTDVGTSWSGPIQRGVLATIEAVPPAQWYFKNWSDGDTTNPRSLSPDDNITLNAVYGGPQITATARPEGTISPSGNISVNYGSNQTFTIIPNSGFVFDDVLVDGVSVGPVSSYTFNNVRSYYLCIFWEINS